MNSNNALNNRSRKTGRMRLVLAGGCALSCLIAGAPALADDAAPPGDGIRAIEDIVVTARRREESIQSVPVAVTAFTGETLQAQQINNVVDITRIAPSFLSVPGQGGGRSLPSLSIRGIGHQDLNILSDQAVSVYFGDVVAARLQGINGIVYDIGTVEVRRGPQGTLFGRNTTGGAVILRPNGPTSEFEGGVNATIGNRGTINVDGFVNLPLAEKFSLRVAAARHEDDGFMYDEILKRNIDYTDKFGGRISLSYSDPGGIDSLTVYDYFNEDDGGTPLFLKYGHAAGSFNTPATRNANGYRAVEDIAAEQAARGMYRVATGTPSFTEVETHTAYNTTSVPLNEAITVKNIFGYRHVKSRDYNDMDATSNSWFPQERIFNSEQFSDELQAFGDHGRLSWIAGLYFFRETGRDQGLSAVGAVDPGDIEPGGVEGYPASAYSNTDVAATNKSYAAFLQASYGLTDDLTFTAGARFTRDERTAIIRNRRSDTCRFTIDHDGDPSTPEIMPPLADCELVSSESFEEPTYNLSLEYNLDDSKLLYVAHRHGYRAGGFGARATTQAVLSTPYNPEKVDDFEIGLKADWHMNNMYLRTNIAGFYANYKDIQRTVTNPNVAPVQTVVTNAAKARVKGVEVDLLFSPLEGLDFTLAYAYTDAGFKRYVTPSGDDLSAYPMARAPENVITIGARYTTSMGELGGEFSVGGSFYHMDGYNGNDDYVPGVTDVEGYELVNIDARWSNIGNSNLDIGLFATNLFNEKYSHLAINLHGLGFTTHMPGTPRTYGVKLGYRF